MNGKTRQIYFGKLASAPAQDVFLKEYFSTAYDFGNLDIALNIYNGWRKNSFSSCDCSQTRELNDDDFDPDLLKFISITLAIYLNKNYLVLLLFV